ncbi:MAG: mechanosensitive ion channel [Desulfuromusa sp.]|nr:mechanosensitive ion channel [Desulfuromusa sp.]
MRKNKRNMIINFHIRQKATSLFCLLAVYLLLLTTPSFVWGQLPGITAKTDTTPQESQGTDLSLEHLLQLQSKARQSLNNAQLDLDAIPPEQIGATTEEIKEKRVLLFVRVFLYNNHIESLRLFEEVRLAHEDLAAKSEAWQGFGQPPPYPIALVDELRDSIHIKSLAITKDGVRKDLLLQGQKEARQELVASEKELRKAQETVEKPLGDVEIRTSWLYELALLKNAVAQTRVLSNRAQLKSIVEYLSLHKKQEAFLKRQLLVATDDVAFSQKELDQYVAPLTQKLEDLDQEKQLLIRDNNRKQEQLDQARRSLQQVRETLAEKGSDQEIANKIHYLQQEVEAYRVQAEGSAQLVELQRLWILITNGRILLWEDRYRLANQSDDPKWKQVSDSREQRSGKIQEDITYIESNLKLTQNLILKAEQRLATGNLTKEENLLVQQKITAYENMVKFTYGLLTDVDSLLRNLQRFQDDADYYRHKLSLIDRLQETLVRSLDFVGNFWNYELFMVDDTIAVGDQLITAQRPVTISKVARALLILAIGLWISSFFKSRISRAVVRTFKADENTALLVEKFLRSIVILTLLIIALITVKIPLAAFAFLGGALAIGVGFGAQALISNFISGIILLFEKPIKAGDLVELEGVIGRVISIGLRCSHVRRFDGVDILVPNSDFLQKSVVNWTLSDQLIRVQVKIGVAYGSPTREVARIIASALEEHGKILKSPEPTILFEDFGDSALIFNTNFWVEALSNADYRVISSDLRHMLDRRFREAHIRIALPQLDVHLDNSHLKKIKRKSLHGRY